MIRESTSSIAPAEFGTPAAASAPTACVIPGLGVHNIAYRDTSGRLHELWRDAQGRTGTSNLTQLAGAPTATGNPFALVDTARNTEILLFRGGDGKVRSLYWSTGPVGHDDLSGTAGSPRAAGDPVGYYFAPGDTFHVVYRGTDNHLHELYWFGVAPVGYGGTSRARSARRRLRQPERLHQRGRCQHRRLSQRRRSHPQRVLGRRTERARRSVGHRGHTRAAGDPRRVLHAPRRHAPDRLPRDRQPPL